LSSLANSEDAILQIGKNELTPEVISAVDEALAKRELIKISIGKNCFADKNEMCRMLAERTKSEVVRIIGRKCILYRPAKKPIIELPKA
ncbi:MAG: YhbY family RNA-binding protein, partial [Lachnospiraceae bacterium]|nr:YhbY family RNA-binding protein [Lachnospiraceae bacterium]